MSYVWYVKSLKLKQQFPVYLMRIVDLTGLRLLWPRSSLAIFNNLNKLTLGPVIMLDLLDLYAAKLWCLLLLSQRICGIHWLTVNLWDFLMGACQVAHSVIWPWKWWFQTVTVTAAVLIVAFCFPTRLGKNTRFANWKAISWYDN